MSMTQWVVVVICCHPRHLLCRVLLWLLPRGANSGRYFVLAPRLLGAYDFCWMILLFVLTPVLMICHLQHCTYSGCFLYKYCGR